VSIPLYSAVRLTTGTIRGDVDRMGNDALYPDWAPVAGTVGYVIEEWEPGVYEVEVSDPSNGFTIVLLTVDESQIEPVE